MKTRLQDSWNSQAGAHSRSTVDLTQKRYSTSSTNFGDWFFHRYHRAALEVTCALTVEERDDGKYLEGLFSTALSITAKDDHCLHAAEEHWHRVGRWAVLENLVARLKHGQSATWEEEMVLDRRTSEELRCLHVVYSLTFVKAPKAPCTWSAEIDKLVSQMPTTELAAAEPSVNGPSAEVTPAPATLGTPLDSQGAGAEKKPPFRQPPPKKRDRASCIA